ncbi:MAG: DUF2974 domain-containing protein [Treponema sp.]|jgi:hypothetical protein|nr:DUF2974 domain-containing protein [Treponema sp.]
MANIFDYLSWRGDLTFTQSLFNPVDNIIFCQLSYLPLDGIVPGPDEKDEISIGLAAEIITEKLRHDSSLRQGMMFKDDPAFISALGESKRFRDCGLCRFVNRIDISQEKQFAALSIITGRDYPFIAYRGTDTTIVGWKENFNMSFSDAVPAQLEAVSYLEKTAKRFRGPLRIGGHSKGGNLAVYAASFCGKKTSRRIAGIYSNDAPGFHRHVIESEGFQRIRSRIYSFVPQFSVVGMLLEHGDDYTVIKSSQTGLMQHDLYSWEIARDDMVRLDRISQESRFVDKTLREWINGLDHEKRERFIETLYTILGAARVESIPELSADWFKASGRMIQSLKDIDDSTRALMGKTLAALFSAARNNINTLLPSRRQNAEETADQ